MLFFGFRQSLWNHIFLGTYFAMFLAMPFAYLITESEGMNSTLDTYFVIDDKGRHSNDLMGKSGVLTFSVFKPQISALTSLFHKIILLYSLTLYSTHSPYPSNTSPSLKARQHEHTLTSSLKIFSGFSGSCRGLKGKLVETVVVLTLLLVLVSTLVWVYSALSSSEEFSWRSLLTEHSWIPFPFIYSCISSLGKYWKGMVVHRVCGWKWKRDVTRMLPTLWLGQVGPRGWVVINSPD